MRVIAGKYRSRPLATFPGADIRPTSDRLRETMFDVLTAQKPLEGTRWLDVFAGTGAVGIEALSRGATEVYFVEASRRATELIRKNLESLSISEGTRIVLSKALPALHKLTASGVQFDVCFVDPPYEMEDQYAVVLDELAGPNLLATEGMVVAEHSKRFELAGRFGRLHRYRKLQQGDAILSFYRTA